MDGSIDMVKKLEVKNLKKSYGSNLVLKGLSFDVYDGELLSIIGQSGCGKTTLFKSLIGIEEIDSGKVLKSGNDITNLNMKDRNMGLVFQEYALFPNMTVYKNIEYPLRFNGYSKEEIQIISNELMEKLGIIDIRDNYPGEISGGQSQRVAIARTLGVSPDIILLDEPLSSLDYINKLSLKKELKKIQKELKKTMIYITHDHEEAYSMSDRIMIMNKGRIEQIGSPRDLYLKPKNEFVKTFFTECIYEKFLSLNNIVNGEVSN